MDAGLIEQVAPDEGETETERLTTPLNPFGVDPTIVVDVDPPTGSLIVDGEATSLKSGIGTLSRAVRVKDPLVPVTEIT